MIKKVYTKYKDEIPYAVFGLLTTAINWGTYKLAYGLIGILNVPSTCMAWLLAVIFAFITDKLWVLTVKSLRKYM